LNPQLASTNPNKGRPTSRLLLPYYPIQSGTSQHHSTDRPTDRPTPKEAKHRLLSVSAVSSYLSDRLSLVQRQVNYIRIAYRGLPACCCFDPILIWRCLFPVWCCRYPTTAPAETRSYSTSLQLILILHHSSDLPIDEPRTLEQ
jgi:hypothetical protein